MLKAQIYDHGQFKFMDAGQTISILLSSTALRLNEAGIESARTEASWMLMHATGRSKMDLIMRPEEKMTTDQAEHLQILLSRRLEGVPIQYVLGVADFYGRSFTVSPDVLIPRPETEELVESVLRLDAEVLGGGVIDLGTGSGCIPITIACERPGALCVGVDVSAAALRVARSNASQLGANVQWVEADMCDPALQEMLGRTFSVLISNPPYIPDEEAASLQPEVRNHEPGLALFSGSDPLHFYRALCEQAPRIVRSGGYVLVEIHADAGLAVLHLFEQAGWIDCALQQDLSGRDRIIRARMP